MFLGEITVNVFSNLMKSSQMCYFFTGMMVGGYVWGGLGDSIGRRGILIVSMAFNSIFAMCSAFALDFPTFLILRFISGLGYVDIIYESVIALYFWNLFIRYPSLWITNISCL